MLFTLESEARWEHVEPVAERLLALAPEDPRALYVVARARYRRGQAVADVAGIRALLSRCLSLGDEPKGRCARLAARL